VKTRKRIILGLSGGKDSVVAASLLKSQDYDVRCIHFRFDHLSEKLPPSKCIRQRPLEFIERIAKQLDLNLKVEDLSGEFSALVQDPAIESRLTAAHFESCLGFHSELIMRHLEKHRVKTNSELIATGHRVRLVRDHLSKKGMIYTAFEEDKDQSHLLAKIDPGAPGSDPLAQLLFPMGEIPSSMVSKIMQELRIQDPVESSSLHSSQECMSASFWSSPIFTESLPKELALAGGYRSFAEPYDAVHAGVQSHSIGDTIITKESSLQVVEFDFNAKSWVLQTPAMAQFKQLVGKDLRWLIPIDFDLLQTTFTAKRPRFPDAAPLRIRLFPFIGSWVTGDLEQVVMGLAPGESLVLYQDAQLVGSLKVHSLFSPTAQRD
jgi:tRNA U34 2-thiouridine synthase MnmA/TrmU